MSTRDLSAERLRLALAVARLGEFSWDARSDVVTFSARAAQLAGTTTSEPLTLASVRELVHPDDRDAVSAAVDKAVRERGEYTLHHRLSGLGRERAVKASGRTIFDDQGELLGIVGVLQDVTSDRFLMHLEDAVRPLIDPEAIIYRAAALLGDYLAVDRCAYCFVEEDADTFILTGNYTRGAHSIVGTYRFRQFGAECLRLMRAGEPYVVADSAVDERIDDEDRPAYELTAIRGVVCVPILKSGRFVAAMAVHTVAPRAWPADEVELVQQVAGRCWESIERARMERERQTLLESAQAANRSKDEFLALLGHELRNPLAPIKTALQLMKLKGERALERERAVIERQTQHLTRLVDDLLDVARIARGMVDLDRAPVELAEIVARALEVAQPLLEQRAHTVENRVPASGLRVDGDAARLTQVVANLLTNAAKYTPPGGRVSIDGAMNGAEVVLQVRDNGIGMTPDTLERAFDRFVQGKQGGDRAAGGLGLGLSIVQSLVQRHGGTVQAHSDGPDQGSELVVRLPSASSTMVAAPASPDLDATATAKRWAGKRVLIVDDNEDAATLLAEALELRGCEVKVAFDAAAALRLASVGTFDLALLDIGLPVMDGYELAGRLRELGHHAPLLALTGYGQPSDTQRAMDAGFQRHLVKPVDLAELDGLAERLSAS